MLIRDCELEWEPGGNVYEHWRQRRTNVHPARAVAVCKRVSRMALMPRSLDGGKWQEVVEEQFGFGRGPT